METFEWTGAWFEQPATPISSFTELDDSSEYFQRNVPSTDSFTEVTNPVIDEWVIDTGDNWAKPSAVWQTTFSMNPITTPPYVSVSPSFDGYGNLITVSSAHYP